MNLSQFYAEIDGNLDDVIRRIPKETSVIKYLKMFVEDKEYSNLIASFEQKDYRGVFRASHTLKGVCANLGLTHLQLSSSEVCESVRHSEPTEDITPLVDKVSEDYKKVIDALERLDD